MVDLSSAAFVPLKTVHATRGKQVRAEPIAAMYTQGKVKHVDPPLAELAGPDVRLRPHGLSPDRLDALVWAVSELTAPTRPQPRVRML